jgi:hypothetical protein
MLHDRLVGEVLVVLGIPDQMGAVFYEFLYPKIRL